MDAALLRVAGTGDVIDTDDSASDSGDSMVRRSNQAGLCFCYLVIALWCLRVLLRRHPPSASSAKPTTSPRTSFLYQSPRAVSARDTVGSWRLVPSAVEADSAAPTSRSHDLFHGLLFVFSVTRAVIWGVGVRVANTYLHLTILIPSLLYLSSLFVLLSVWCRVRDELVSKFAGSSGSGSVSDTLRWPLTLACAGMWLGLVAVCMVETYTGQIKEEDSAGTHLVVWYLGSVYALVSVLFGAVGTLLVRWLGEVAALLSLTAKERVDLARSRVFIVTLVVGPLSALRSGMTLIQLFRFADVVTENQWYPTGYYIATELLPVVVMLSQVKSQPQPQQKPQQEPESRRVSAISAAAEPSPPELPQFLLSTPRHIARTGAEFSPPLAAIRASVRSPSPRPPVAESSGLVSPGDERVPISSPRTQKGASPNKPPVTQRGSFRGPLGGVLASSAIVRLTASPPPVPTSSASPR
eukprot:Hpha_TRINITY_DN16437_c4_g6::TRINITY_DN16437_c4_g6_i1::g.159719::m.159719